MIFYVMDGSYLMLFPTVPVALTGAAQMRADGISRCSNIVNVHYVTQGSWTGTLVDLGLLSVTVNAYTATQSRVQSLEVRKG